MQNLLEKLNDVQREAVRHTHGPLLILAGAGSGKTTVLVNRVAYIIANENVRPYNILAFTFTNKAAREMKERIERLIGDAADSMWIGTFHSMCMKILRRHIDKLGYDNNFVIYDSSDALTLLKDCMKELNISDKNFQPRSVLSDISSAKDDMINPDKFEKIYSGDYRMSVISKIYALYQKKLKNNNALDFDDIIANTVKIFEEYPEVLEYYQLKFQYILVDEYQDTNNVQYRLINMLAQGTQNLCVVGDDDQSIYKFRGANIRNILDFEKDFPNAKVVKLEQNYRSTQSILDAANAVIGHNKGRKGKALWTDNNVGEKVRVFTAVNEHEEAQYIAQKINELVNQGYNYNDFAVLYRANAQSRVVEDGFLKNVIPYRVLSGLKFYDRKEIKDIIAYLKVIQNPHDDVSLKRIINEPKRGIGATTVEKMQSIANEIGTSIFAVASVADQLPQLSKAKAKLASFEKLINSLIAAQEELSLSDFVIKVMKDSGYLTMLEEENTTEARTRIENLNEFMSVVQEHEENYEEPNLATFLESVALVSDIDSYDEEQDAVVMMTIHSAKGLEFPVVFIVGMEDGIFPGMMSMQSESETEEERRLCYVAITRAKQLLYMTKAETRMLYGSTKRNLPSRFLKEIPSELKEERASNRTRIYAALTGGTNINPFAKKSVPTQGYSRPASVGSAVYVKEEPKTEALQNLKFNVGDVVMHKKMGRGVILDAMPIGNDVKLEINFESVGIKHLMAVFAKLERVKE